MSGCRRHLDGGAGMSDWKIRLLVTSTGAPRPLLANAITALREAPAWIASFVRVPRDNIDLHHGAGHQSSFIGRSVRPSNLSVRCSHSAKTEAPNERESGFRLVPYLATGHSVS